MANKAADMLKDREERKAKLVMQLAALDAEIRVLREVLGGDGVKVDDKRRDRKISEKWAFILRNIGNKGRLSLSEIQTLADETVAGGIKPDTLRSQLSTYVSMGLLERPSEGVFTLTALGADKCGFAGGVFR